MSTSQTGRVRLASPVPRYRTICPRPRRDGPCGRPPHAAPGHRRIERHAWPGGPSGKRRTSACWPGASAAAAVTASMSTARMVTPTVGIPVPPGPNSPISAVQIDFNVTVFDTCEMGRDRHGPGRDRLLIAQLAGSAQRHAQWGGLTCAEKAAGAAELREIAGDRPDLLAETAGLALGTSEGKRAEFEARGQAIAELCRMAGADEDLMARWIEEGRRRAGNRPS